MIAADLGDFEFVKTIGPDTDLIRIRIDTAAFVLAAEIGSPPEEFAVQSNRMSPAGVPMFYGAFELETAKAETLDPAQHAGQTMSIGTFRALRDLRLLDLAELPDLPSVFDMENHYLIHPLRFLHAFAEDLAKPIARDGREHIEYVPTQIVTEYFRRVFQGAAKAQLDGLIYRSARQAGGKAFVLFCENAQCVEPGAKGELWDEPLLCLEAVLHEPCPGLPNLL
ncbi:RES domain-containing protein [Patescibacteria group bacterium]|nr:MAG: RES domain-containing protein [Patescibacteria group bacterium]